MDEEQAKKLLLMGDSGADVNTSALSLPSADATRRSMAVGAAPASFEQRNFRDFPIDMTEGLPFGTRVAAAWRGKPEQKLSYLEGIYGKGNVRMADDETPLVRILGPDQKPKEVPLSARGLDLGDVASMSAYIPETLAAIAAMRVGRKIPFIGKAGEATSSGMGARAVGFARDVTAETVGQETGAAAKDIVVGAVDDQPIDLSKTVSEHAANVPLNMAVGAGMGVIGKGLGKVITPTEGVRGAIEADVEIARKHFKDTYGAEFTLTVGEKTGSPIYKRTEATMKRLPGSSSAFDDIRTEKADQINRIMNRVAGVPEDFSAAERAALPSEETVGGKAVAAIRQQVDPMQRAVDTSRSQLAKDANEKIMAELESATMADRQLYPEKVGEAIRAKAVEKRAVFQGEVGKLYEDAYALPGGTDRTLTVPSLPGDAKKLLDALPQKAKIVEDVGYDSYGSPVLKTREGQEVMKEFVPANVAGKLQTLASLKDQKMSLKDLVAMRTEVANDIAQGEAIPGVQTHYLGKIRDALTKSIDEATDSLPDGNLKAAWQKANNTYRDNVGQFHEGPVARLFKDIESRGFVRDEDIIRNIGSTEYGVFKKFLGETSPEFGQLKRAIVDQLLQSSTLPGGALVDGKMFATELASLYKKNRAIADDIIGGTTPGLMISNRPKKLAELAGVLEAAQGDGLVDAKAFRDLLASDRPLRESVQQMTAAQQKLDKAYRSQIVKDIGEKKLGENLDAAEFVNRFYSKASPEELKSVVSQLQDNPLTLEDLRRKVIEKTFYDAQRAIKDADTSNLGRGELFRPSGSKELDKVFGDAANRERMQIMLGNRTYKDFEMFAKLLRGGEVTEQAFAGAGGISAGMQTAGLIHGGVFSYMADWGKQKLAAIMLTAPVVRKWIGNTAMSRSDQVTMTRAFIASTPFVEAVANEFPNDAAASEFINGVQRSVNTFEKYGGNKGGPIETPESKEKRMKALLRGGE